MSRIAIRRVRLLTLIATLLAIFFSAIPAEAAPAATRPSQFHILVDGRAIDGLAEQSGAIIRVPFKDVFSLR